MSDTSNHFEATARQFWDMGQRIAVQIAEKPLELREAAFAVAERNVGDLARRVGIAEDKLDSFVKLQMQAIRQFVTEIDVSGSPKGGHA